MKAITFARETSANPGFSRRFRTYAYGVVAKEVSSLSRCYDRVVQCDRLPTDDGLLFSLIEAQSKESVTLVDSTADDAQRPTVFFINGNLNATPDAQALMKSLRTGMHRHSRVVSVLYSSYLGFFFNLLNWLGLRRGRLPTTYLTNRDLQNLAKLSGFEITRLRPQLYFPFRALGLGMLINAFLRNVLVLRWLALTEVVVWRPRVADKVQPSLSIIIPARNEAGNLPGLFERLNAFDGIDTEIIFVEGNSTDDTWVVMQKLEREYRGKFAVRCYQQTGKGKKDAVLVGMRQATKDLVTILDADLTMPPEWLIRFYDAYREGAGDVINGNRLLYPMEAEAMRFLNWLGNVFFGKSLSFVLETPLTDSLCGTKLFSRAHYRLMQRWNDKFGDFDPFGDFHILFSAAALGLGITDLPVPYKARTYGTTNILRFRHGLKLLKMTLIGLLRIRLA